ncbi:MAG TPA: hypothetical protein DCY20_11905 [Firmicutes bacterium]|nr:hypothetical protein [Bacillota bacterium]
MALKENQKCGILTLAEVNSVCLQIQQLISNNCYTISKRGKNDTFSDEYSLKPDKKHELLSSITYENYSHSVRNHKPKFEHEILHVFGLKVELDCWGELKEVEIYIKINICHMANNSLGIVISLHEAERELSYPYG